MTHAASKTEAKNESKNIASRALRSSRRLRLMSGAASLALPMASAAPRNDNRPRQLLNLTPVIASRLPCQIFSLSAFGM
ncbi:MAG: hypothetical protein WAL01_16385, partial [Pseudolabrys sp.]